MNLQNKDKQARELLEKKVTEMYQQGSGFLACVAFIKQEANVSLADAHDIAMSLLVVKEDKAQISHRHSEIEDIETLENNLVEAKNRLEQASDALSNVDGDWGEFGVASENLLACERKLAAARAEEYAEALNFPVEWDVGAPLPHLFINDHKTYLIFYVKKTDPNWDGSYITVVDPSDDTPASLALVEFHQCTIAKLGDPNDEVFDGHSLQGKGLDLYSPLEVINSNWIKDIKKVNSVHRYYQEESWDKTKHYLFGFHDTTFECIAESFSVELFNKSVKELMSIVCQRLVN